MDTKLYGTGLLSDEFNARMAEWRDGTYGVDADMMVTVCQQYMTDGYSVVDKIAWGEVFNVDDLALWMEENVSLVRSDDWEVMTEWLGEFERLNRV